MYCLSLSLYRSASYPLFAGAFYERLAELNEMPTLATLLKSLRSDVEWPDAAQVYYLENLREQSDMALFQVRFQAPRAKDYVSIFLSVQESTVQNLTVQFPPRGGRTTASKMIEALKSVIVTSHIPPADVTLVIEGFMEVGAARFIRETRLSGFVWVEGLGRYLHVTEDPARVKEVQKGRETL